MAKQFSEPIKVNTRIFVARFEPRAVKTTTRCNNNTHRVVSNKVCGNRTEVLGCTVFQDNGKSALVAGQDNLKRISIVGDQEKSSTSCHDNGA